MSSTYGEPKFEKKILKKQFLDKQIKKKIFLPPAKIIFPTNPKAQEKKGGGGSKEKDSKKYKKNWKQKRKKNQQKKFDYFFFFLKTISLN